MGDDAGSVDIELGHRINGDCFARNQAGDGLLKRSDCGIKEDLFRFILVYFLLVSDDFLQRDVSRFGRGFGNLCYHTVGSRFEMTSEGFTQNSGTLFVALSSFGRH